MQLRFQVVLVRVRPQALVMSSTSYNTIWALAPWLISLFAHSGREISVVLKQGKFCPVTNFALEVVFRCVLLLTALLGGSWGCDANFSMNFEQSFLMSYTYICMPLSSSPGITTSYLCHDTRGGGVQDVIMTLICLEAFPKTCMTCNEPF